MAKWFWATLGCGCYFPVAMRLRNERVLVCPEHKTAQSFVIDGGIENIEAHITPGFES